MVLLFLPDNFKNYKYYCVTFTAEQNMLFLTFLTSIWISEYVMVIGGAVDPAQLKTKYFYFLAKPLPSALYYLPPMVKLILILSSAIK